MSNIEKLNQSHLDKICLLLSTYQDGTGRDMKDRTLFGWEDFEDVIEMVFDGQRLKSKSVFDIIIPKEEFSIGISCKMTKNFKLSNKSIIMDHSRINAEFFNYLKIKKTTREEMFLNPQEVGNTLMDLINNKTYTYSIKHKVDLQKSFFLVLGHDESKKEFNIFQFPLRMPKKEELIWNFNKTNKQLQGKINDDLVIQWFYEGGGQVKLLYAINKSLIKFNNFTLKKINNYTRLSLSEKLKLYYE